MRKVITATILAITASPALAIEFPIHAHEMGIDERIGTGVHAPGGGPQTNAKDLLMWRNTGGNSWSRLVPGASNEAINANYLIYNRPVHAMAAGKVVACWRNAPEGAGHIKRPEVGTGKIFLQGNLLWIKQTDGNFALYAHARPGDIPASLCPKTAQFLTGKAAGGPVFNDPESVVTNGATVTAGQLLFHAGNSGNSSEPHLHMHLVNAANTTQVMKFDRGMTTPFANNSANLNGPWTRLNGGALPMAAIQVWPPHPIGNWTWNNIPAAAYQRIFDHYTDSRVMLDTATCKNDGASYNTNWIPAKGSWAANHGMTAGDFAAKKATYAAQGYTMVSAYTCGSRSVAVWRK
ncbi:MAG: hypothetical protein H7268_12720 [Sandarakinorhabdus sp.]|nr:hypothetical protein [Sandarakinorhabdus sp.]